MPKKIQDQFSSKPVSWQVKYQLRKKASGLCANCGKQPKPGYVTCEICLKKKAAYMKRTKDKRAAEKLMMQMFRVPMAVFKKKKKI